MHVDARNLPNHSVIEGDVCIVGAGVAGILGIEFSWLTNWVTNGQRTEWFN